MQTAIKESEPVALSPPYAVPKWAPTQPTVRKALSFIKRRGGAVTTQELVDWDAAHGRRLFNWDDRTAAEQWRLQQARMFLNSFRAVVDGMRVRGFINVRADEESGLDERTYVSTDVISANERLRQQVVEGIGRRMKMLASELRMWKLNETERAAIFEQLRAAMEPT